MQQAVSIKKYAEDVVRFLKEYPSDDKALFAHKDGDKPAHYGLALMATRLQEQSKKSLQAAFVKAAVDDLTVLVKGEIHALSQMPDTNEEVEKKKRYLEDALYREKSFHDIYTALHKGEDICLK